MLKSSIVLESHQDLLPSNKAGVSLLYPAPRPPTRLILTQFICGRKRKDR